MWQNTTPGILGRKSLFWPSVWRYSPSCQVWWQMCEVVDYKNHSQETDECQFSACFFLLSSPGTLAHRIVLPTFRIGLPTSVKPLLEEMPLQIPPEACLLHNPKYHDVDSHISHQSDLAHIIQSVCLTSLGYMSELYPVVLKKFCFTVFKG